MGAVMNQHYKKLRALIAILTDEEELDILIADAMVQAGTPVSKSRLLGWRVSPEHKNYRHMTSDELLAVMDALIMHFKQNYDQ